MNLRTVNRDKVRFGIVGCGTVADYGHIPAIDEIPEAELVAFADPNEENRNKQVEKYGKPAFASMEEMIENVEIDAVSMPVHPQIKLDLMKVAAKYGLHVFSEKPLTDTLEHAEELVRTMNDAGLFVGVAFIFRGEQGVQRIMQLLRENAIGRLHAIHIENLWDYHGLRGSHLFNTKHDRRRRSLENLGTLDCGVHKLDMARYMSGSEFRKVNAVGAIVESVNKYPDHIITQGVMENGVIISIEESGVWGYTAKERPKYDVSYKLVGESGIIKTTANFAKGELYIVSGEEQWTEEVEFAKGWTAAYSQFCNIIMGKNVPNRFLADAHDGLINMKLAETIINQCMAEIKH